MSEQHGWGFAPGDMVVFDRPPVNVAGVYEVTDIITSHVSGVDRLKMIGPDGRNWLLSAEQMTQRRAQPAPEGQRRVPKQYWGEAGRRVAVNGAGPRPKIHQLMSWDSHHAFVAADKHAAQALAQRAADDTGEPMVVTATHTGEIVIGTRDAVETTADGLRLSGQAEVVNPGVLGGGGTITIGQIRDLLDSDRARSAVTTALGAAADGADDGEVARAVLQAVAALLPAERTSGLPGWRVRKDRTTDR